MKNKRDLCISTTRKILQDRRISFKEMESSTGTIYFKLFLGTSTPCLRISDHHHGRKRPSFTFYWMVGDNAKNKDVRRRLERTIDRMIKNSKIGITFGILNKLGG